MARISRANNERERDTRWGGQWRPSSNQLGLGLAGLGTLGTLGYLASKYPKQATRLAQKGLHGLVGMAPKILIGQQDPGKLIGQGITSAVLPGSVWKGFDAIF